MKPNRHRLSARIDGDIAALLQQAARRRNVATSAIVNAALRAYLAPEAGDDRESVVTAHLERLSRQLHRTEAKVDELKHTAEELVLIMIGLIAPQTQCRSRSGVTAVRRRGRNNRSVPADNEPD